jgi:dTDP-glucose pyrophosphorylase
MQIIVPAAGNGSRFSEQGYRDPKPLIKVLNKPLIRWSTGGLNIKNKSKYIFLVQQSHIEQYHIDQRLSEWYDDCSVIPVVGVTEGQACTVLLAKDMLDMEDELAIVNCDNLFSIDLNRAKRELKINDDSRGIIFFIAGNNPAWSYVATDDQGFATQVAEKIVISDKATVGCYYFTKARYFVEAAELMIERDIRYNGEFYVSLAYNIFLENNKKVHTWPCDFHFSLGTPEQVDSFISLFKN